MTIFCLVSLLWETPKPQRDLFFALFEFSLFIYYPPLYIGGIYTTIVGHFQTIPLFFVDTLRQNNVAGYKTTRHSEPRLRHNPVISVGGKWITAQLRISGGPLNHVILTSSRHWVQDERKSRGHYVDKLLGHSSCNLDVMLINRPLYPTPDFRHDLSFQNKTISIYYSKVPLYDIC